MRARFSKPRFTAQMTLKLDAKTRALVESIAEKEDKTLGQVTRDLIDAGIEALGLKEE